MHSLEINPAVAAVICRSADINIIMHIVSVLLYRKIISVIIVLKSVRSSFTAPRQPPPGNHPQHLKNTHNNLKTPQQPPTKP